MLIGRFDGKLGGKHQVALPKRFRSELGDDLIITKGLDNNLIIVSQAQWQTLLEGTEGRPFTEEGSRNTQRFLLGNASPVSLDSKGRFVIPDYLRTYAFLQEEIVFAGIARYVELWDKKTWEEKQEELSRNISKITEKLTAQGKEQVRE